MARAIYISVFPGYNGTMKVLTDYMKVAGMTQAELAKRAELSAATLNHILRGRREPRIAKIRKLSEVTGISIEKLVEGFK